MYGGVLKNYLLCVQKYLHATAAWLFIIACIASIRAIAMVAIVRECVCCAVENERHFGEFVLFVVSLHIGQEALVHVLCTNDEQGGIRIFTDDGGIGNNLGWRTVEDDVGILISQLFKQLLQAVVKALASTLLSMFREVVFGVGFALLLPVFLGLDGVLYSMPVSDILTFVISLVIIVKTYRELHTEEVQKA